MRRYVIMPGLVIKLAVVYGIGLGFADSTKAQTGVASPDGGKASVLLDGLPAEKVPWYVVFLIKK
jgi:hypothetical protein